MIELLFRWAWDWLLGWGGLSIVVAIGAGAAWWLLPPFFIKTRSLALHVAIGALAFNAVYTMGFQNGAGSTKAEWDAANARGVERGRDAREQSEQEIPPVVEEPAPAPAPGAVTPLPRARAPMPAWMRNDKDRRNDR